jgi:hypothetical protein
MKHSSIRELFAYWNDRRGARLAPDRSDIDPAGIRGVLADTFILAFDAPEGHPFRIAGTRVAAVFGRALKGESFVGLWSPDSRPLVVDLLNVVAHESIGAIAGARVDGGGSAALEFELLTLPLLHRGRTDARILGALVPTQPPVAWLGTATVGRLALGTLRYLGPQTVAGATPHIAPALPGGRLRRGLMVYDGGQA